MKILFKVGLKIRGCEIEESGEFQIDTKYLSKSIGEERQNGYYIKDIRILEEEE